MLLWSPLQEHSAPDLHCISRGPGGGAGLESGGLSLQPYLTEWTRSRVSKHHAAAAKITDSVTAGVDWTAWYGSRSPSCLWSLSVFAFLAFACLSCVMSTAGWESRRQRKRERERERESQCNPVCACVSVNDCWLLEYKWDVLIHLNQGHMLGPRVKCSERNEALYCICHSAQEIKPGICPVLHEILRVTFNESVVINWLPDWTDSKILCHFHVHYILVVCVMSKKINNFISLLFLLCYVV